MTNRIVKRVVLPVGLLTAALAVAGPSFADTVSSPGSTPVSIDTANGTPPSTIQLNVLAPTTFTGSFTQGLTFVSGFDGAAGPVPFTVNEDITLDGITQNVSISGVEDVSPTTDPDTINILSSTSPVIFGDLALTVVGQTFNDSPPFPGGVLNTTQTFDVAPVPLPASFPLFLSGLAAVGFLILRRKRSAQGGDESAPMGMAC